MSKGEGWRRRIRGPQRVALARRILKHEKGRTALAITGVFMAILLIFVELDFFFVVPQGGITLAMASFSALLSLGGPRRADPADMF
jgi:hypothetical protein